MQIPIDWNVIAQYGVFAVLFCALLVYVLNETKADKAKLMGLLECYGKQLQVMGVQAESTSKLLEKILARLDKIEEDIRN